MCPMRTGSSWFASSSSSSNARLKNVFFHYIKTNESWCRDHGPAFVLKKSARSAKPQAAIVDWGFNAWGGKYPPYDDDDRGADEIAEDGIAGFLSWVKTRRLPTLTA